MPYFKDTSSKLHFIADAAFAHLLPAGSVPISDSDVEAMRQPTALQIEQEARNKAKASLEAIDRASIRSIREYIASRPDAPQILKDREAAAVAERVKVKP